MKQTILVMATMMGATALFGADACCSAANTLSAQEKNEGWRLLWNGVCPEGWRSAARDVFP